MQLMQGYGFLYNTVQMMHTSFMHMMHACYWVILAPQKRMLFTKYTNGKKVFFNFFLRKKMLRL